ncbi:unnamed protein product [[Candida] boidinii]|uniref:Unnamed protein product n=1 Tax=Candida boidinii TaxID=5477 RepID=A0A9W6SWB3_CANBO|nr:hypothetical protein B5S30_g4272 [[Candida] boidinii]OWB85813.1 hypothetical protein B5S33_g4486 [[Candida] boidinii]GME67639.1 unnamed protein product [[Candida] boidinii]
MVEQFSKKTEQVVETTHETYELNDTKEGTQSPKLKVESIDVNILRPEAILHGGSSAGLNDFETNRSYELETLDVTRDNAFEYSAEVETDTNNLRERRGGNVAEADEAGSVSTSQITDYDEGIDYPDGGTRAWIVLFGAFLGFTVDFGLINSTGAIQAYIAVHQLENVSNATTAWIFSLFLGCSYCGGIVSGILFDETGVKIPFILGTVLLVGGLFITANAESIGSFIGGFGIICGLGCALCMNPLMGVVSHWFKKKRAMAMGLATLGGSVGGIVFPLMLNSLYPKVGFVWAIRILAFICLIILVLSFILIKERLSANMLRGEQETSNPVAEGNNNKVRNKLKNCSKNLIKYSKGAVSFKYLLEPKFFFCALAATLSEISLVCSMTYFASYAIFIGQSESTAFVLLTVINAVGIVGRYTTGLLADMYGVYNVMIFMIFGVGMSHLVIWLGVCSTTKTAGSLYAYAAIFGFFSSAVLSLSPACCGAISPTRDFGKRYATMYFVAGIFFVAGITIAGVILGNDSMETYNNLIIYCGVLAFVGDLCWVISRYFIVGLKINVKV